MLADLLNIDDDTVIELDKLAGEPLDIKVNNILLGKAGSGGGQREVRPARAGI